jgi:hypothetical protein
MEGSAGSSCFYSGPTVRKWARAAEARNTPPGEGMILYGARTAGADPCVL